MNSVNFLIGLFPLILLVALLVLNRYPGERFIERLRQLIDLGRPSVSPTRSPGRHLRTVTEPVRGGQLIARSMAGRAPPAAV